MTRHNSTPRRSRHQVSRWYKQARMSFKNRAVQIVLSIHAENVAIRYHVREPWNEIERLIEVGPTRPVDHFPRAIDLAEEMLLLNKTCAFRLSDGTPPGSRRVAKRSSQGWPLLRVEEGMTRSCSAIYGAAIIGRRPRHVSSRDIPNMEN